jgi:hypothetical protein
MVFNIRVILALAALAVSTHAVTTTELAAVEAAIAASFGLQPASYGVPCEPCAQGDVVGGLLRLGFHDATGGSGRTDGCIDRNTQDNAGLEPIVLQLHDAWVPFAGIISFADTVVVAGNLAIRVATTTANTRGGGGGVGPPEANSGPLIIPFRFGRLDSVSPDPSTPFTCSDQGALPAPTLSFSESQQFFGSRFGLTPIELVALFGAHSCGRAEAANSGIEGGWTAFQSSLSTLYYRELVQPRWNKINAVDWRDNQNHLQLTSDVELVVDTSSGKTSTTGLVACSNKENLCFALFRASPFQAAPISILVPAPGETAAPSRTPSAQQCSSLQTLVAHQHFTQTLHRRGTRWLKPGT